MDVMNKFIPDELVTRQKVNRTTLLTALARTRRVFLSAAAY
ncbi:hypothetical protein C427_1371 [Paraglaciecola psychrophila 170]|uniref:Uncharacterized protein n=1 Tax=Paraglaciecola psychrophila 170 TaxID=1129794 RepID=K7AT68_9ALTE|nr:hypothetical protein C427_1371 [Paraglaciecola psychrophila 170]GAC38425.1 hypothetical protein GPSY_2814 [Paraglaciecola psychrophila 170]